MLRSSPLILTLISSLAAAQFAFGQTRAPLLDLASADWSVKQAKILNGKSGDDVWKFMNDRWGNTDLSLGKVCAFQFADLRDSGSLSLVVSYNAGGTADCNYVEIYDKSASVIEERDFQANSNGAYFDSIQDLGGDGHLELIVDKYFGAANYTEGGSNCEATQSVIYAWNSYSYVDVSTKYPGYYRKVLSRLRKEIEAAARSRGRSGKGANAGSSGPGSIGAKLPPSLSPMVQADAGIAPGTFNAGGRFESNFEPRVAQPTSVDAGNLDCARAEADHDMRILGISRDAGIADAIHWAQSENKNDRDFASSVLSDMGIPTELDTDGYVYAKSKEGEIKITKRFKYRSGMFEFKRPRTWPPPSVD